MEFSMTTMTSLGRFLVLVGRALAAAVLVRRATAMSNVIDVIEDVEQNIERSEEDEVIERLKESSGGRGEFYYDGHFGGTPAALYRDEAFVPEYDADLTSQVSWLRPHEFSVAPEYFIDGTSSGDVIQGRLGDCWIMGSIAAVANHPDQLIENLFGSDPDDFKKCVRARARARATGTIV